jgi:hypothetical protein
MAPHQLQAACTVTQIGEKIEARDRITAYGRMNTRRLLEYAALKEVISLVYPTVLSQSTLHGTLATVFSLRMPGRQSPPVLAQGGPLPLPALGTRPALPMPAVPPPLQRCHLHHRLLRQAPRELSSPSGTGGERGEYPRVGTAASCLTWSSLSSPCKACPPGPGFACRTRSPYPAR